MQSFDNVGNVVTVFLALFTSAWIDPSVRWVTPNHFSKPTVKNMVQHINERVTDDGLEVQLEEEEIYEKG